jgi:hypothetical protein
MFAPEFNGHTPFDELGYIVEFKYTRGWKREVQQADCLVLVLVWTRTRRPLNILLLVFGLTYANLSFYLRFGFHLLMRLFMMIQWNECLSHQWKKLRSIRLHLWHSIHCCRTAGQWWIDWSCICRRQGIWWFKNDTSMDGPMSIT